MTRAQFIAEAAPLIEEAIMRAQGIGDNGMREPSPEEVADDIASLLPPVTFEDEQERAA